MFISIRDEILNSFNRKLVGFTLLILLFPTFYGLYRVREYSFIDWLGFYSYIVGTYIPLVFPIIVMGLYLPRVFNRVNDRFFIYMRVRKDTKEILYTQFISNAILVFIVTFLMAFIPLVFLLYAEPLFGIVKYAPESAYLYSFKDIHNDQLVRVTFSNLIDISPIFYGFVYSIWVGINGVLWATVGLSLILIVNNIFLAVSIPFVAYHIFNFIPALIDMPQFSFMVSVFPFNIIQKPIPHVMVPSIFLLGITIGLIIYIRKKSSRLDSLL